MDGPPGAYAPSMTDNMKSRALATRPVSARTWTRINSGGRQDSGTNMGGTNMVKMFNNDLFGDGDVLGSSEPEELIPAQTSPSAAAQYPTAARLQQQKDLAKQKRVERLQAGGIAAPNAALARPTSANPSGPPSSNGNGSAPTSHTEAAVITTANHAKNNNLSQQGARGHGPASQLESKIKSMNMQSVYDPTEEEESDEEPNVASGVSLSARAGVMPAKVDIHDIKAFLMQPGPQTGPVLCYIVRDKASKMYPKYSVFLEDGNHFLLSARKRKKSRSSNYLISLDGDDMARHGGNYFGKVRSNFVGTEFVIYDRGAKSGKKKSDGADPRQELGAITYQYNVLGTRGPRKMTAVIPQLDRNGTRLFKPTDENDTILERLRQNKGLETAVVMKNKSPKWNEQLNAYCLNFNGRVTEASVKNFQLITDDNREYVILQFGKIGKDTFTMDYQWPMSCLQAFSICLSSFDNKLACE